MFRIPINDQGWGLIVRVVREFAGSPVGGKAIAWFALIVGLLVGFNGFNILNSYVGRDFMTALANRDSPGYIRQALLYLGVFAVSTVIGVFLRYAEERLGLLWREWMTRSFVERYLRHPTYYRMNDELIRHSGIEHPDQRIADDVRVFTTTTLSFTLLLLNGAFTVAAFSGVLWSISSLLFGAAVLYALVGSYFTVYLGSPLIDLNYAQLDKEAAFRSGLLQVRDRAESVALLHYQGRLRIRLMQRFADLAANFRKIIGVNRNLGFFTTGYNYLAQIVPILLTAPLYIEGRVDFGVITQSAMAFATLIAAFSLIVTQFQSISSFAAVVQRLINLWYVIELVQTETVSGLDIREEDGGVIFERVTLRSPINGRVLVRDLDLAIPQNTRVLITGPDDAVRDALFKALAGLWDAGTGRITRPSLDDFLFLPERPYLPPGTLRQALIPEPAKRAVSDERMTAMLYSLGLANLLSRAGGLDAEHNWDSLLSTHELQLVSFARIVLAEPRFAVLYRPSNDLDPEMTARMLSVLAEHGITYLTVGRPGLRGGDERIEGYDAVLEIDGEGRWEWKTVRR
jgi:putative ATP-binding cassette transporter